MTGAGTPDQSARTNLRALGHFTPNTLPRRVTNRALSALHRAGAF
jgi:hypothetical protein